MNESDLFLAQGPASWADSDKPWLILVVDDDPEVIAVTKLVSHDMIFKKRPIEIIEAASAKEAKTQLEKHPDIAVIVLDVVMETDHAGLELVKEIRGTMNNPNVRILLRTGQPGQAPEREVILDYDINDYRLKSDLTSQSLFSSMVSALRSYEMVRELEFHQKLAFQTLSHQLAFEDQLMSMLDQPALHTDVMAYVTGVNQAMSDLMGIEAGGMLGQDVGSVLPEQIVAAVKEREISEDQVGVVAEKEVSWANGEGKTVSAQARTQVFRMADQSPGGIILTLRVGS